MKRELLQNVKILPYTSGDALDTTGFNSVVIGAIAGSAGTLTITITQSDSKDGVYDDIKNIQIFVDRTSHKDNAGVIDIENVESGNEININVDIIGLKNYIKITATGAASSGTSLAVALGDGNTQIDEVPEHRRIKNINKTVSVKNTKLNEPAKKKDTDI